jgi:tetratricopeptide (TPR) repeat protein
MEDKPTLNEYLYIKERLPTWEALFLGSVLLVFLISVLDNFSEKIFPSVNARLILYAELLIIWGLFWLSQRKKLPRNKKDRVGLIICVKTENNKQKIRLKNDLVRRLNELVLNNNLSSIANIILLNNYQADKLVAILNNYSGVINAIKRGKKLPKKIPVEIKNWLKIQRKIRGHFFVWGDIKERTDGEKKYFFDLEALVIHNPVNLKIQNKVLEEFVSVWCKNISFQEKIEFRGFKITADFIFMAARYIIGIAALISRDPTLALDLHQKLKDDLSKYGELPPNLKHIKNKLSSLLAEECLLLSELYYSSNDLEQSKKYLEKSLAALPNNYGAYLFKAILEFQIEKDTNKALKTVRVAKRYAENDGTWRYSEGFLLMYLEKFEEAMGVYKKISESTYPDEELTLRQVYQFNITSLEEDPDKIQSYFILGYLKLKKSQNYPEALQYFEKFINVAQNLEKFNILTERAKSYKIDLEKKMEIPQ